MIKKIILMGVLSIILISEGLGQKSQERNWKDISSNSKTIIVGIVEKRLKLIRPEKYKLKPDGSTPNDGEFTVGELFRVKVVKKLKGEIQGEKEINSMFLYIFTPGGTSIHDTGNLLIEGKEYIFFLEPNKNQEEFSRLETIEYKPKSDSIRKPFEPKPIYLIVYNSSGIVRVENDRNKLIKEIKRAI